MGTRRKTPEVLDNMVEHVRYELTRSMELLVVGDAWCYSLDQPFRRLSEQSILEAGLITRPGRRLVGHGRSSPQYTDRS